MQLTIQGKGSAVTSVIRNQGTNLDASAAVLRRDGVELAGCDRIDGYAATSS
jgi:hypothetical protein